jgi:hypothetical protein
MKNGPQFGHICIEKMAENGEDNGKKENRLLYLYSRGTN